MLAAMYRVFDGGPNHCALTHLLFRNGSLDHTGNTEACSDFANLHDIYLVRSDGEGESMTLTDNDTEAIFWHALMVNL